MREFGEIAESLRRSTVQIFCGGRERSGGSGVVWSADGLIITNSHVVRAAHPTIELFDGQRFEAQCSSRDPRRDLAALRVPAGGLPAATAGDSTMLRPGELAIAIGNPLGFRGALSTGVIHSIGPLTGMGRQSWVRATVRLAPGNSGGPLANADGHVVGINTAIIHGLGVAVPSREIAEFLRHGARPRLGLILQPVHFDAKRVGMLILEVESGSAAEAASLRIADLLIAIDGRPLASADTLGETVDSRPRVVRLQFLRGDRSSLRETVVRLESRAEAA